MLSVLNAQRFVMIVGDEGAVLVRMKGAEVVDRCFAASAEGEDRAELEAMLEEAPRLSVTMLVDVLEQSFVKDTIPPVGLLDEGGVLQRKMRTTFPDARIKGALSLGRDKDSSRRDKRFMFVALPESPVIDAWLAFLREVRNPVAAIALLPVESVSLATKLSADLHEKNRAPDWVVLVTRQRTGGFRQIVVHKGELVFSRLTQSLHDDATIEDVANTIEREHKLTMGYLRRMSFNKDQGIDVIVLAQPEIERVLLSKGFQPSELSVITPADAAERCKLSGVAGEDDDFGEILHAAWLAQRRRPVLPLIPEEIVQNRVAALTTRTTYALTAIVVCYASFQMGDAFLESVRLEEISDQLRITEQILQDDLDDAFENVGKFTVSAPEVRDTIKMYERLGTEGPSPMPLLARLAVELGQETRLNEIQWRLEVRPGGDVARLIVSFDILNAHGDVERAIETSDRLHAQVAEMFPDYLVEVTAPPADILPNQSLVGTIDLSVTEGQAEELSFTTELLIEVPAFEREPEDDR